MVNRPWRPIPSGRISRVDACLLRIFLVPICLLASIFYGWDVFLTSAGLTMTMVVYDELNLAGHWIGKNACNVFGYLTFEIGATKVMGIIIYIPRPAFHHLISVTGRATQLDIVALRAMAFSTGVIFTTIQAQDFSDIEGDLKLGRITLPIYAPSFSRVLTLFAMVAWSAILGTYWLLGPVTLGAFCCLGTFVGWRYYSLRASQDDSKSYMLFNVSDEYKFISRDHSSVPVQLWLLFAHFLPAHARWNILFL